MKKKNKLKKIIIIIVVIALVVGVVAVVLNRDNDADEITLADIPIITFFGITDSTTTPEDIRDVEWELNNVLITDGYAVKLYLAPEDRYQTMIASAKDMMDAYMENNKKSASEKLGFEYSFNYETSEFEYKCDDTAKTPAVVYNQDTILELLEQDVDINPNAPSMDVVLVTNYDDYYTMALNGEFTRLNSALTDIAKSLKQSIPDAFFEALKLNSTGDIYGIPSVQVVGQYEFLLLDQDLLTKYGVSKNQLVSVEDLDSYLKTVAADSEVDAIPLLNAPQSSPLELADTNSIGVDSTGTISLPYIDSSFQSYYGAIARYRSLGLMGDVDANVETDDFAVAFFRGTEQEVEALIEKTGKNLVYNKFSKPYATSEGVGEAVFCVCAEKKYSVSKSDYGIDFVCKLNAPKSQTDIKNILLYGALGVNYSISDVTGYVEYANGNTYGMSNLYTGHTLHAHPSIDKGVSNERIAEAQAHNLDLLTSKLSGFKFTPKTYSVKDNSGNSLRLQGPDYLEVINNIVSGIYTDYINGVYGAVDIEDFNKRVDSLIKDDIANEVKKVYEASVEAELTADYTAQISADTEWMTAKKAEAESSSLYDLKEKVTATLKEELTAMYNSLGVTDAEDIANRLAKDITDELVEERLHNDYSDQQIADAAEAKLNLYISNEVAVKLAAYKTTDAYTARINAYANSAQFSAAVNERFAAEREQAYYEVLDSEIADNLYNFGEELKEKLDEAIVSANEAFIAEHKGTVSDAELAEINLCESFNDFYENMLRRQYYDLKGEPK